MAQTITDLKSWSEQWYRWKAGTDCPFCAEGRPEVTDLGTRYMSGKYADAYLVGRDVQPGLSIVVWRGRHVVEPTELSEEELTGFFGELITAARAVETRYSPIKTNYQINSNARPHLHARIVPRYDPDPAPGTDFPWPWPKADAIPSDRLRDEIAALKALIG